jgi:hypothetical protein
MSTNSHNLLITIAANVNNKKLTDYEFRQFVKNSLKTHDDAQAKINELREEQDNEIVSHSITMAYPLISMDESDISIVYTHNQMLIDNIKRTLDVYQISNEKESIILDLTGFEDAESDEFNTLVELFGYENAEKIAGFKIQLIYIREG